MVRLNEHDPESSGEQYRLHYEEKRIRWTPTTVQDFYSKLQQKINERKGIQHDEAIPTETKPPKDLLQRKPINNGKTC